ncbi:MAG: 50S ribosomal protein L22, partial [Verrucomicrobia bacterium]|nr:50S ribosomal protein L22 [Verrucomicrobiota bacterium]
MEIRSIYRGARISAFKAREVTREIQGLAAASALDLLAFSPKKAAFLIGKTLKSAIANAENNNNLRVDTLVVKEATVGEGPTMKRSMSRARGSSSMIAKRTSHIRIILTDEIELEKREPRKAATGTKRKPQTTAAAAPKAKETKKAAAPAASKPSSEEEPAAAPTETVEHKAELGGGPGSSPAAPKVSSDEDTT